VAARRADSGATGPVRAAGLHLSLEHAGDPAFQRRDWRAQRAGRGLLAAFLAASALGVTGPGPLSRVRLDSPDGLLSIRTERILHRDAPAEWRLAASRPIRSIRVTGDAVRSFELGPLGPGSAWRSVASGELVLELGEPREGELAIPLTPREAGRAEARFRVEDGPILSVTHLVLP
jgi:hypothetical protein